MRPQLRNNQLASLLHARINRMYQRHVDEVLAQEPDLQLVPAQ